MHHTDRLLPLATCLLLISCSACEPATHPTQAPEPAPATTAATPAPLPVIAQFREASEAFPQALLSGTVIEQDGCIRARTDADPRGYLLVWQPDHQIRRSGDRIEIVDGSGQIVARVGEPIRIGGGEQPEGTIERGLTAPLPPACTGPYWMVGQQ